MITLHQRPEGVYLIRDLGRTVEMLTLSKGLADGVLLRANLDGYPEALWSVVASCTDQLVIGRRSVARKIH